MFIIYHIPDLRKVGITNNLERRVKQYRQQGYVGPVIILETLQCSIKEAGKREFRWADHFGYRRGYPYSFTWKQHFNRKGRSRR